MTGFKPSKRSMDNLRNVHPEIVAATILAMKKYTTVDFVVICGARSEFEQREMVRRGASKTMNSMHLIQPSGFAQAVDIFHLRKTHDDPWTDYEAFGFVNAAMQKAAKDVGIILTWGGWWGWDFGHFEKRDVT